jgi:hypothetical protein
MMHKVRWDAKSKQYVVSLVACREGQQDSREAVTIITTTRLEDVARHTGTGARGQNRSRAWELLRWCCNPFPARRAMRIIEAHIHFLPILCEKAKSCVVTWRQSARFLPLPIRLLVAHKRGAVVSSNKTSPHAGSNNTKQPPSRPIRQSARDPREVVHWLRPATTRVRTATL